MPTRPRPTSWGRACICARPRPADAPRSSPPRVRAARCTVRGRIRPTRPPAYTAFVERYGARQAGHARGLPRLPPRRPCAARRLQLLRDRARRVLQHLSRVLRLRAARGPGLHDRRHGAGARRRIPHARDCTASRSTSSPPTRARSRSPRASASRAKAIRGATSRSPAAGATTSATRCSPRTGGAATQAPPAAHARRVTMPRACGPVSPSAPSSCLRLRAEHVSPAASRAPERPRDRTVRVPRGVRSGGRGRAHRLSLPDDTPRVVRDLLQGRHRFHRAHLARRRRRGAAVCSRHPPAAATACAGTSDAKAPSSIFGSASCLPAAHECSEAARPARPRRHPHRQLSGHQPLHRLRARASSRRACRRDRIAPLRGTAAARILRHAARDHRHRDDRARHRALPRALRGPRLAGEHGLRRDRRGVALARRALHGLSLHVEAASLRAPHRRTSSASRRISLRCTAPTLPAPSTTRPRCSRTWRAKKASIPLRS